MRKFIAMLALGAALSMTSSVSALTTDGDWSDWFAYGGNVNQITWNENLVTPANPIIRSLNDEEGPTPGGGGQRYDIEQIFYQYQDNDPNALTGGRLCIGLVTGFPPEGVPADNLYAGDMFLDIGNTGSYTHAIGVSTRVADAARFEQVWANTGAPNWTLTNPTFFPAQTPYRVDENAPGAANVGTADVAIALHGVHYFYEICLDVTGAEEDALTNEISGGLGLHWTMQCGNDVINVRDDTPLVPVPEPSTFALLGMGMLGVALRRKFTA